MVEHLFFTIIFIISLNFSLGALRFSKINRTFLSMYRGIFEASVVTINDLGEPIYPYFDENVLNHYVDDYLKENMPSYVENYTYNLDFFNEPFISEVTEGRYSSVSINLKAYVNAFFSYDKTKSYSIWSKDLL